MTLGNRNKALKDDRVPHNAKLKKAKLRTFPTKSRKKKYHFSGEEEDSLIEYCLMPEVGMSRWRSMHEPKESRRVQADLQPNLYEASSPPKKSLAQDSKPAGCSHALSQWLLAKHLVSGHRILLYQFPPL